MPDGLPEDSHLRVVQRKAAPELQTRCTVDGSLSVTGRRRAFPLLWLALFAAQRAARARCVTDAKPRAPPPPLALAQLQPEPSRVPDQTGHRRLKWLACVVMPLSWPAHKV